MAEFVYLYRGGEPRPASPEAQQQIMQKWVTWMKGLAEKGHLVDRGQPLERSGKIVKGSGKAITGLAIGLTITMDILGTGPISGAAMNPARWFGPAIVDTNFSDFWVWIVGPIVGGLVAAFLWSNVLFVGEPEATAPEPAEHLR